MNLIYEYGWGQNNVMDKPFPEVSKNECYFHGFDN